MKNAAQIHNTGDIPDYLTEMGRLVGYCLRRAQQAAFQHFSESLNTWQITPGQLGILVTIAEKQGITQTALARAIGVQRATLGEVLDKLEQRRLVQRCRVPTDRRSYAIRLTREGELFLAELFPHIEQQEREFTQSLSEQERLQLVSLLKRLSA